jgi:excisionase family DNA binding protein
MAEETTTAVGAYLNLEEAAKFLRISPRFVQKLYLKGDLPVERLGRRVLFDPAKLKEYMDARNAARMQRVGRK